MPLSWNEIKSRAVAFSNEWKNTSREEADAKPFLIEFLHIFGISQKRVATFEHRVRKLNDASGYIDLLWPGTLLVEMKSKGQDLDKAYQQAREYCHGLKDYELPKLILICDFNQFHVYQDNGVTSKFELAQLIENLQIFEELAGYQKRNYYDEDPVNIAAAELMGKLHDQLKDVGYTGAALEAYLVRLLFILFADDSTIFQKGIFFDYVELRTKEDGSDLAMHLDQLFQVLDTPEDKRLKTLDEQLNQFPYVNGRLFAERLPTAAFTSQMRQILLDCCKLDWGKISPAIFGSLFQSVMDSTARRNLGAHYTSEKNIMKLIKPLFLDELWEEFHAAGENHNKLKSLHGKISKLRFLDPACGCGNFLITAYRELRMLELAIVEKLLKGQMVTNINQYFLVDLDQFYGIELGEFPSQIAQVAMFLIDHQCNMMVSDRFGEYIPLIPLQKSAIIVNENALRIDWQTIIKPLEGETEEPRYHYLLGNPPFVGKQLHVSEQEADIERMCIGVKGSGVLDYVSCWYVKAAAYMDFYNKTVESLKTRAAFVSTNSICQGEQVGVLWSQLFQHYKSKIMFAHQTFKWGNEAKNNAAVHVIIIGFSNTDYSKKYLFEYTDISKEPTVRVVSNISPYLVEGSDIVVLKRKEPICKV
ncbi:MAG: DNA methyltransferase, partial [bacterium]